MPKPKPIPAAELVAAIAGTHGCSQAEARQKAIRARVAKKERARDTRRKILVGSLLLHKMENDPEACYGATMMADMHSAYEA